MSKTISSNNAPAAVGPYSPAVEAGGLIFVSGQLGLDPQTGALAPSVEEQAGQAIYNLEQLLVSAGSGLDKVVKTTLFIKDMRDFGKVNEIYGQFFKQPYPARSCVEVARLPKDGLFEIEAIAEK